MDLDTLIVTVFCLMDDALPCCLDARRLRRRGPQPQPHDSEVLCIEAVGEYLGFDQDRQIFDYFRRHFSHLFPTLQRVHRTTFARQSANLWQIKARVWQQLLTEMLWDRGLWKIGRLSLTGLSDAAVRPGLSKVRHALKNSFRPRPNTLSRPRLL